MSELIDRFLEVLPKAPPTVADYMGRMGALVSEIRLCYGGDVCRDALEAAIQRKYGA